MWKRHIFNPLFVLALCMMVVAVSGFFSSLRTEAETSQVLLSDENAVVEASKAGSLSTEANAEELEAFSPVSKAGQDLDLLIPVEGVRSIDLVDSFHDARGPNRTHRAIDIMALRHTPVRAAEDGVIARLFQNRSAGLAVYQFGPDMKYSFLYAHLQDYAEGLMEGKPVRRGEVIGYVGSSGNAPDSAPHLHFAVYRTRASRWWGGEALNPFALLDESQAAGDGGVAG